MAYDIKLQIILVIVIIPINLKKLNKISKWVPSELIATSSKLSCFTFTNIP